MNRLLLIITFILIILIGALHQAGSVFYFYWSLAWFDNMMHFLGGLSMGLLFLWIRYVSGLFVKRTPSKKEVMINVIIFVAIVSIGWEIFEYVFDIANPTGGKYLLDTSHDLISDFVGAITAGLLGRIKKFYE
jgi:hypothetical protein